MVVLNDPAKGWRIDRLSANRWVFERTPERKTIMIDATYLKAHRTASSLRAKKGGRATGAGA